MFTTTLTSAALAVDKNEAGDDDLIIVTQSTTRNITVFTPDGKLVLAFRLLINKDPRQAIKLPGNLYATTFGYEPTESHYVCRFNKEGYIVGRCFGGERLQFWIDRLIEWLIDGLIGVQNSCKGSILLL